MASPEMEQDLEFIMEMMNMLRQARPSDLAYVFRHKLEKPWKPGASGDNQTRKRMDILAERGLLVKGKGFYKIPSLKVEVYSAHDQEVNKACIKFLCLKGIEAFIKKEVPFANGTQTDAVILLVKGTQAMCIILEVCVSEPDDQLKTKAEKWLGWPFAKEALSELFGINIEKFGIVVSGRERLDYHGFYPLDSLLFELKEDNDEVGDSDNRIGDDSLGGVAVQTG